MQPADPAMDLAQSDSILNCKTGFTMKFLATMIAMVFAMTFIESHFSMEKISNYVEHLRPLPTSRDGESFRSMVTVITSANSMRKYMHLQYQFNAVRRCQGQLEIMEKVSSRLEDCDIL